MPRQLSPWDAIEERTLSPLQSSLSDAKANTSFQGPTEPTLDKVPAETPKTPGSEEQRPVPFLLELAGNPARPKLAQ